MYNFELLLIIQSPEIQQQEADILATDAAVVCECEICLKRDIGSQNLLGLNLQGGNHQTGQFPEQSLQAIYKRNYFCS